jgi:GGDEF domain-containing protein
VTGNGAPIESSAHTGRDAVLLVHHDLASALRRDVRLAAWLTLHPEVDDVPMDVASLHEHVLRAPPRLIMLEGGAGMATPLALIRRLKSDPTTAITPIVLVTRDDASVGLDAGADDVLVADMSSEEVRARLNAVLRRSERDLDVHPSTRLPGARAIDVELRRRLTLGEGFAAGYADLDHFKEFNDRYGYHHGNRVILLVSKLLHDVVKGRCGTAGFVGHIGGDDFLFVIPLEAMAVVCDDIIAIFDELIPYQYSEQDRDMGYFFGKDRRGQLHRVPLMSLSIGVVTTQSRRFTLVSEVSDLATEMKTYAKGRPGSLWAVDRRGGEQGTRNAP